MERRCVGGNPRRMSLALYGLPTVLSSIVGWWPSSPAIARLDGPADGALERTRDGCSSAICGGRPAAPNAIKALARCGQGDLLSDEGLAPLRYPSWRPRGHGGLLHACVRPTPPRGPRHPFDGHPRGASAKEGGTAYCRPGLRISVARRGDCLARAESGFRRAHSLRPLVPGALSSPLAGARAPRNSSSPTAPPSSIPAPPPEGRAAAHQPRDGRRVVPARRGVPAAPECHPRTGLRARELTRQLSGDEGGDSTRGGGECG